MIKDCKKRERERKSPPGVLALDVSTATFEANLSLSVSEIIN